VARCQLEPPGSIPEHNTSFFTMTPVIGFTTTIVDNFSCYFPTNSRDNFTTNLLVFETREISKGVIPNLVISGRKDNFE
jgi:hypothetical protein